MTNLYDRQESLGINQDQRVVVVGCGGIGSWLGYFLALAGVRHLDLFDGDKVETHNLNRLPFTPKDVGRFKSDALAELISHARPDVEVVCHPHFDAEYDLNTLVHSNWVVVSTDSHKSRKMVFDATRNAAKICRDPLLPTPKYLECGADGMVGSVTGAPAEWVTEMEDNPGYQSIPVFVAPCTFAASIATYFVLKSTQGLYHTFRISWDDLDGVKINSFSEGVKVDG